MMAEQNNQLLNLPQGKKKKKSLKFRKMLKNHTANFFVLVSNVFQPMAAPIVDVVS